MNFIFLGPPGAGKGTLASKVAENYSIPHISTGEIFRAAIKNGTELGLKVKAVIDAGELVSDDLTVALVKERLSKEDAKKGFILDGFPRTIAQAESLESIATIDAAVNFEIADNSVVERLSGRRVCKKCGHNFHITFQAPKIEGICDLCGGNLYTRDDDKIEAIKNRLVVYRKSTSPLIDFYRKKNILVNVDAKQAPEVIRKEFEEKFPRS